MTIQFTGNSFQHIKYLHHTFNRLIHAKTLLPWAFFLSIPVSVKGNTNKCKHQKYSNNILYDRSQNACNGRSNRYIEDKLSEVDLKLLQLMPNSGMKNS